MAEGNFQEHLQAEIKQLQERLDAKKRELGTTAHVEEREVFREIFRERFDELTKAIQSASPAPAAPLAQATLRDDTGDDTVKDLKKEEMVEHLIYAAFEKGLGPALKEAQSMGDFWVDELHDRLADEYYEKLLEFRRVQQL